MLEERRQWVADYREDGASKPVNIRVIGIGGAGGNAVTRMMENEITGVELISINTDAQALSLSKAMKKLQIGVRLTNGRGAGGNPQIGRQAAEEDRQQIASLLENAEMVFLAAGMGGGTGTGATPVVAQIAREKNILTVAVVTKPFTFEGKRRMEIALQGINELRNVVDALIVIPNQRLFEVSDRRMTMRDAFKLADEVLAQAVQGVTDLVVRPGVINIDFSDIRAALENAGTVLMGVGYGHGENRVVEAAQQAISNPLLEASITGARNVVFGVFAPSDLLVDEVKQAADIITNAVNASDANVSWGLFYDDDLKDQVKIILIASGFGEPRPSTTAVRLPWERREISREAQPSQPSPAAKQTPAEKEDELDEETLNIPSFLRRSQR